MQEEEERERNNISTAIRSRECLVVSHQQQQTRSDRHRNQECGAAPTCESGERPSPPVRNFEASTVLPSYLPPRLTEMMRHDMSATMCQMVLLLLLAQHRPSINHDLRAIMQEP
jgi:hypothetical protein